MISILPKKKLKLNFKYRADQAYVDTFIAAISLALFGWWRFLKVNLYPSFFLFQ